MQSPIAVVFDEDPSVRERAREALVRAGMSAVLVATPHEALEALSRLRAEDVRSEEGERILGRSESAEGLRQRVRELAVSRVPVLFTGEVGSGRRHAARVLHALSMESGSFVSLAESGLPLDAALAGDGGTVLIASIEDLPWASQKTLAATLASAKVRPRVVATTSIDPRVAAEEGRISRALVAAFGGSIVRVSPLRERRPDVAVLARAFIEELRLLNALPTLALAPDSLKALEGYAWPGNIRQLRGAVEASVILAADGIVRPTDLPAYVFGEARPVASDGLDERRFRDAKRTVVEAFERAYLAGLLKRHHGNVTSAADHSGMLRSALQRLLRKHDLHSADFRRPGTPDPTEP